MSDLHLGLVRIDRFPDGEDEWWEQWLSAAELAVCRTLARAPEHLAARWAAKRAIGAALGASTASVWRDIEVGRRPFEPPRVLLRGAAEAEARRRGVQAGVSLTHAAGHAAALAWLSAKP